MEVSKVMVGHPRLSSIYRWIFHERNHPAIGMPPFQEAPRWKTEMKPTTMGWGQEPALGIDATATRCG